MRRVWGIVAIVLLLVSGAGLAGAQTESITTFCDPVTLEDLFPELYGPDDASDSEPATEDTTTDDTATDQRVTRSTTQEEPAEAESTQSNCVPFVYEFTYPVAGRSVAISSFGANRSDHQHKGNDIAAAALTPVVAARDGQVSWVSSECCALAIRHDDGWSTYYIHLNNDTFSTDDGLGWGIVPGLQLGSEVHAGQVIGWVGDSGNAEESQPHLHFELRNPAGIAVDPAASLTAARTDTDDFAGPFADDDGSPYAESISVLTSIGLLTGCGDNPSTFCPDQRVGGIEIAVLLERLTDLDITNVRIARSPEGPWQDTLATTRGIIRAPNAVSACALEEFCDDTAITFKGLRDLAILLPELSTPGLDTLMTVEDLAGSILEQIDGATPLAYCSSPGGYVTKGELAEIIARALGMTGPPPCDQIE